MKAPSRIAFENENEELDENAWGYQIDPGMKIYAHTKLLLDESALPSDYDDPNLYLPGGGEIIHLPKGKSAKDVATEYLKGMREMFEDARDEKLSAQGMDLDSLAVDFWLTVPASWSEKAKLLTKNAAVDAGFGTRPIDRVMLIPEPEAAAHYALKSNIYHIEGFVRVCVFMTILVGLQPAYKIAAQYWRHGLRLWWRNSGMLGLRTCMRHPGRFR